jgi:hypothetical protein
MVVSIESAFMKNHRTAGRLGLCLALGLICPTAIQAQVIITAADMFNQPGQYYKAYANATNNTSVSVSGMLGNAGGPQLWDFTSWPSDVIYRFDYLAATNAPHSADFVAAGARMAEQKTNESAVASQAWLYFTQDPVRGRLTYGFYDPEFSAGIGGSQAEEVFSSALNDFPATIRYGDAWSSSTTFTNTIIFGDPNDPATSFSVDLLIAYSAADVVDAWGTANSPGIGFGDCLRVNELVTYDTSADFNDGSGFQHLETDYVRNYYWLRPGRGIVAQVTSQQSNSTPPDNNFLTATAVARMFETNHPDHGDPGTSGGIQGLKLTLGPSGALLQWTALASVTSYRVEYIASAGAGWQPVGITTANYLIDAAAGKPNTPMRFYRVVGLP